MYKVKGMDIYNTKLMVFLNKNGYEGVYLKYDGTIKLTNLDLGEYDNIDYIDVLYIRDNRGAIYIQLKNEYYNMDNYGFDTNLDISSYLPPCLDNNYSLLKQLTSYDELLYELKKFNKKG